MEFDSDLYILFSRMGIFTRFFENSSFAGLPNITNSKSIIKQVFWAVISILMICGASYLTGDTFHEWEKNPVSTMTEIETIYHVKFPDIVVCPPKVAFSFTDRTTVASL